MVYEPLFSWYLNTFLDGIWTPFYTWYLNPFLHGIWTPFFMVFERLFKWYLNHFLDGIWWYLHPCLDSIWIPFYTHAWYLNHSLWTWNFVVLFPLSLIMMFGRTWPTYIYIYTDPDPITFPIIVAPLSSWVVILMHKPPAQPFSQFTMCLCFSKLIMPKWCWFAPDSAVLTWEHIDGDWQTLWARRNVQRNLRPLSKFRKLGSEPIEIVGLDAAFQTISRGPCATLAAERTALRTSGGGTLPKRSRLLGIGPGSQQRPLRQCSPARGRRNTGSAMHGSVSKPPIPAGAKALGMNGLMSIYGTTWGKGDSFIRQRSSNPKGWTSI